MRKKVIGIYCLINKINLKCYIGQSVDINSRWNRYKRYECKKQCKIHNALKKYGVNNFDFEIIEIVDREILDERERFWIWFYDSVKNGYNIEYGGGVGTNRNPDIMLKCSNTRRRNNSEWGIYQNKNVKHPYFFVNIVQYKLYKSGFRSIEDAKIWRDGILNGTLDTNFKIEYNEKRLPDLIDIENRISKTKKSIRNRPNFGIYQKKTGSMKYFVNIIERGIKHNAYGFPTIESAREWRDNKLKELNK